LLQASYIIVFADAPIKPHLKSMFQQALSCWLSFSMRVWEIHAGALLNEKGQRDRAIVWIGVI